MKRRKKLFHSIFSFSSLIWLKIIQIHWGFREFEIRFLSLRVTRFNEMEFAYLSDEIVYNMEKVILPKPHYLALQFVKSHENILWCAFLFCSLYFGSFRQLCKLHALNTTFNLTPTKIFIHVQTIQLLWINGLEPKRRKHGWMWKGTHATIHFAHNLRVCALFFYEWREQSIKHIMYFNVKHGVSFSFYSPLWLWLDGNWWK